MSSSQLFPKIAQHSLVACNVYISAAAASVGESQALIQLLRRTAVRESIAFICSFFVNDVEILTQSFDMKG